MNKLEADSIIIRFNGETLLSNVYITVVQGQIVGLLGRNGCGKSTLLKIIFGSLEPEQKSIRINGQYVSKGYAGSRVYYLPQDGLIPKHIKIIDALRLFQIETEVIGEIFPECISHLGKKAQDFSGGELKFLELIILLHGKSLFCLLDEPFSGLSPVMIERAVDLIRKAKTNKGILVTDHLYRNVTSCADELYCISPRGVTRVKDHAHLVNLGYLPE